MRGPNGWSQFIYVAHRSPEGREAFRAYREQRELALAAPAKLNLLGRLLERHNGDRVLIFTHDNATVYTIARRFLVPVITHQTKTKERRDILLKFNSGAYPIVATSRVLNEGVNVPEANVAVVLSGSGSVREHVQRLGRVLRKSGDKEAVLYEVITRGTVEEFTSNRRRQHSAYGGKPNDADNEIATEAVQRPAPDRRTMTSLILITIRKSKAREPAGPAPGEVEPPSRRGPLILLRRVRTCAS